MKLALKCCFILKGYTLMNCFDQQYYIKCVVNKMGTQKIKQHIIIMSITKLNEYISWSTFPYHFMEHLHENDSNIQTPFLLPRKPCINNILYHPEGKYDVGNDSHQKVNITNIERHRLTHNTHLNMLSIHCNNNNNDKLSASEEVRDNEY